MPSILITGATRGIGLELCRHYAAAGWRVIATCRDPDKAAALRDLAHSCDAIRIERLDVTDATSIAALAERLKDETLDVLINNAGILSGSSSDTFWADTDDKSQEFGTIDANGWDKVLRANTIAPIMVTQALLPQIKRGAGRKIIMVSSCVGSIAQPFPNYIAYATSKAALNMAMRNVAMALQNDNITVVSLHPGWVKTDMGGPNADITVEESVAGMRKVIYGLTLQQSGGFIAYDGNALPW